MGRFTIPQSPSSSLSPADVPPISPRPICTRIQTVAGRDYDEAIRLRNLCSHARLPVNGGASLAADVALVAPVVDRAGGEFERCCDDVINGGNGPTATLTDWSLSEDTLGDFISFIASTNFPDPVATSSLVLNKLDILWSHSSAYSLISTGDHYRFLPHSSNLSKEPRSYAEAIKRPDADAWRAVMDRKKVSLTEMGAFEEVVLLKGEKRIGLKWVFAYKKNVEGANILEKARVVAQGFNQKPGQFDKTYAPVAKLASICILLTWAAVRDLDIYQFDCKTAFLHAKIRHPIFARQFPGYTFADSDKVLCIKVALYGLQQSAFKFYSLLMSLLLDGYGSLRG